MKQNWSYLACLGKKGIALDYGLWKSQNGKIMQWVEKLRRGKKTRTEWHQKKSTENYLNNQLWGKSIPTSTNHNTTQTVNIFGPKMEKTYTTWRGHVCLESCSLFAFLALYCPKQWKTKKRDKASLWVPWIVWTAVVFRRTLRSIGFTWSDSWILCLITFHPRLLLLDIKTLWWWSWQGGRWPEKRPGQ